jgi:hypothetical protein
VNALIHGCAIPNKQGAETLKLTADADPWTARLNAERPSMSIGDGTNHSTLCGDADLETDQIPFLCRPCRSRKKEWTDLTKGSRPSTHDFIPNNKLSFYIAHEPMAVRHDPSSTQISSPPGDGTDKQAYLKIRSTASQIPSSFL